MSEWEEVGTELEPPHMDSSVPEREVVAIRTEDVGGHQHIVKVKLKDGSEEDVPEVIRAIEAHDAHYVMTPPEGAPAYQAHQETGLKLLLQTRPCPDCEATVIFA